MFEKPIPAEETKLREQVLHEYLQSIGSKGGLARTDAQRASRRESAKKMRAAKLKKRQGRIESDNRITT